MLSSYFNVGDTFEKFRPKVDIIGQGGSVALYDERAINYYENDYETDLKNYMSPEKY